jgi:hypothetical protein
MTIASASFFTLGHLENTMNWSLGPYEASMGALLLLTLPIHGFLTRKNPEQRIPLRSIPSEIKEKRYFWHISLYLLMFIYKAAIDHHNEPMKTRVGGYTYWIYKIEGDWTSNLQHTFLNDSLTILLSAHYLFMYLFLIWFSPMYYILSRDKTMADKSALNYLVIYLLSVPFYLFFNVEVTSSYIPGVDALLYHDSFTLSFFTANDPMDNAIPSLHIGLPIGLLIINRLHCKELGVKIKNWRHREFDIFIAINVLIYIFSIQYLGIHWLLDIIPGIGLAFVTSYFVNQIQPKLRSDNFTYINSILPNKKQLYSILSVSLISTFLIFFVIIDGPGTSDEKPNYRLGFEDINLETIEVHSLTNPVDIEVINIGEESIQILLIKTIIAEKYAEKGIFDWDALSSKGEILLSLPPNENTTFSVITESIYDSYLILTKLDVTNSCDDFLECDSMKNRVGEVRIKTYYFDDELIWTAYLFSLPSFYVTGYVLGMRNKEIMGIKAS